jgi:hypothetical protein
MDLPTTRPDTKNAHGGNVFRAKVVAPLLVYLG